MFAAQSGTEEGREMTSAAPYLCGLFLACSVAMAQNVNCSALALTVESVVPAPSAAWRMFLTKKDGGALPIGVRAEKFSWKIEERSKQEWTELLTGGVGPGTASTGAEPHQSKATDTMRAGKRFFLGDFDVRRDVPDKDLKAQHLYRITFRQEVYLSAAKGALRVCNVTSTPHVFRSTSAE